MEGSDELVRRKVSNQRYHIAGSAGVQATPDTLRYAHRLIKHLTASLISKGGTVLIQLGEEPLVERIKVPRVFDWTILEQVQKVTSKLGKSKSSIQGITCIAVGFSNWRERVPSSRVQLLRKVIDAGVLEIVQLPKSSNVGGIMREKQAFYGDILVTLGGGAGVAHLIELYRRQNRPVIPLDLPLAPGKDTASQQLNLQAMEQTSTFFEYLPRARGAAALASLSVAELPTVEDFTKCFLDFVVNLRAPQAFLGHLLKRNLADYPAVKEFFSEVVTPFIKESGFSTFDPKIDATTQPFLNVEVFEMIRASSLVVIDLTKLRPNCLIELGFSLGHGKKTIVTAIRGTKLPFDVNDLPCHFWRIGSPKKLRRTSFEHFVSMNIGRRSITT